MVVCFSTRPDRIWLSHGCALNHNCVNFGIISWCSGQRRLPSPDRAALATFNGGGHACATRRLTRDRPDARPVTGARPGRAPRRPFRSMSVLLAPRPPRREPRGGRHSSSGTNASRSRRESVAGGEAHPTCRTLPNLGGGADPFGALTPVQLGSRPGARGSADGVAKTRSGEGGFASAATGCSDRRGGIEPHLVGPAFPRPMATGVGGPRRGRRVRCGSGRCLG